MAWLKIGSCLFAAVLFVTTVEESVEGSCGSCGRNETQTSGLPRCKGLNWKMNTERLLKNEHLFLHGSIFLTMYHAFILRPQTHNSHPNCQQSFEHGGPGVARALTLHIQTQQMICGLRFFLRVLWSCPWTGAILFGKKNKLFHGFYYGFGVLKDRVNSSKQNISTWFVQFVIVLWWCLMIP